MDCRVKPGNDGVSTESNCALAQLPRRNDQTPCAAHSANIPDSASSPSVSAAGPGCRISGDLISRSQPVRTAGIGESLPR